MFWAICHRSSRTLLPRVPGRTYVLLIDPFLIDCTMSLQKQNEYWKKSSTKNFQYKINCCDGVPVKPIFTLSLSSVRRCFRVGVPKRTQITCWDLWWLMDMTYCSNEYVWCVRVAAWHADRCQPDEKYENQIHIIQRTEWTKTLIDKFIRRKSNVSKSSYSCIIRGLIFFFLRQTLASTSVGDEEKCIFHRKYGRWLFDICHVKHQDINTNMAKHVSADDWEFKNAWYP